MSKKREEKISTGYTVKADTETGILKAYVSIFGIEDDSWMNDIIEPGAFKKTIAERGPGGANKIRVLWMHQVREVIGRPLLLEEHSRDLLPEFIREKYPLASGGLYAETQLVMEVQRAREAFALYRAGAMDEWSIGFDPIDERFEDTDKRTIRRLREIKLWEYSPVTWGANPATTTIEVKGELLNMLQEIKTAHPEYDDQKVIRELSERLGIALVIAPAEAVIPEAQKNILNIMDAVKSEHPDYNELQLIQAVEKRLSPDPVIPAPEQEPPPRSNDDHGKWVASRRSKINLCESELNFLKGRHGY